MGLIGGIRVISVDAPSGQPADPPDSYSQHRGSSTPQALDQQGITPAEVRWALYGPLSHAPLRIASRELFAIL